MNFITTFKEFERLVSLFHALSMQGEFSFKSFLHVAAKGENFLAGFS